MERAITEVLKRIKYRVLTQCATAEPETKQMRAGSPIESGFIVKTTINVIVNLFIRADN